MELFLQFGWGMIEHSRQLIQDWGGGTVILSPRDLVPEQLLRYAKTLPRIGGTALVDPQFYLPHADHERLRSHAYWPSEYDSDPFWTGIGVEHLLRKILDLNHTLACPSIILPGTLAESISDDWLARQSTVIDVARRMCDGSDNLIATIALSEGALSSADQVHQVLEAANKWKTDAFYVICEHPRGDYLVTDPNWLSNVDDLVAGLRLKRKKVILGYSQHQMLIAAAGSVTAIASGTWMNVRSFPPEKFRLQYDEEFKRSPAIWYYSPQALSEFTLPFLDLAKRQGVLGLMAAQTLFDSQYGDKVFSGPQPSSSGFAQPDAFRHYLQCLRSQAINARRPTFDATVDHHSRALEQAASVLDRLHSQGVKGQLRDFRAIVDVNDAALQVLKTDRGSILRREWKNL